MGEGGKAAGTVVAVAAAGIGVASVRGVVHEIPMFFESGARQAGHAAFEGLDHSASYGSGLMPLDLRTFPRLPVNSILPRPIVLPQDFGSAFASTKEQTNQRLVKGLVTDAKPQIVDALEAYRATLTLAKANDVVSKSLVSAARETAAGTNSIKFEALSGKLTMEGGIKIGRLDVTLGDVNVYKISSVAAIGILACKGLSAHLFETCVNKALANVGRSVFDQKDDAPDGKGEARK